MTGRNRKVMELEDVPGSFVSLALLSGSVTPFIKLLESGREVPRMVSATIIHLLREDPSKALHLVRKQNQKKQGRGRPPKSLDKKVRDFEMGIRVWHLMQNKVKYENVIHDAAEEFGVKAPTAAKAYQEMKHSMKDSGI